MRFRTLLRGLIAALFAPALVLGALDLHSSDLPHGAFDGPSVVLADARHPLAPEHFESSVAIHIPPCVACLLHSKTSGSAVVAPAIEPQPIVAEAGFVLEVGASRPAPDFALRPRAPPAA